MISHPRRHLLRAASAAGLALLVPVTVRAAAKSHSVTTYRQPGCSCCEAWAERMKEAGFTVTVAEDAELDARRARLGIPADLAGCHISLIGDYAFEGHVPPADVLAFLEAKPDAIGLAVPGMPMGSPGMEAATAEAYDVLLIARNGPATVFARH